MTGILAGGIYFISNAFSRVGEINTDQTADISVLQEQISALPEIKADVKVLNENVIRLMVSQGIRPVEREQITRIATTTPQ